MQTKNKKTSVPSTLKLTVRRTQSALKTGVKTGPAHTSCIPACTATDSGGSCIPSI